jgi:heterodisulfide reductase subunit B
VRIGYYPGCSLLGSSRDFGESVLAVCAALDVELVEVPDWHCCGASSAHALSSLLATALPANLLASAAAAGLSEVVAPCAACYNRLAGAKAAIEADAALRSSVEEVLGRPLGAAVRVINILELLDRVRDRISAAVKTPFGLTAACYYGCLLVRPPRVVGFDRAEDPTSMDALVLAAGGKTVAWSFKTECCGAGLTLPRTGSVARLAGRVVADATRRQADVIVVACPMCHSNLDLRRGAIDDALGSPHGIPVLFITQVVGLALGLAPQALGLNRHFVPVRLPAAVAG